MSDLVTKDTSTQLQVYTDLDVFGAASEVTSSDVQMPSVILMQDNSSFVKDRTNEIKGGDFVHSVSEEVLGNAFGEPLELVVVDMFKTEVISEAAGKDWISTRPWTPAHESLPYEDHIDGVPVIRQKCFNYVCFRPLEVREVPTPEGSQYVASPLIVKMKGASGKFGKKFNQTLKDMADFRQPSWSTTFKLTGSEETNEKGTYFVWEFKRGEQTIKEVQIAAYNMCKMSQEARKAGQIEVIDAEERKVKNYAEEIY